MYLSQPTLLPLDAIVFTYTWQMILVLLRSTLLIVQMS